MTDGTELLSSEFESYQPPIERPREHYALSAQSAVRVRIVVDGTRYILVRGVRKGTKIDHLI